MKTKTEGAVVGSAAADAGNAAPAASPEKLMELVMGMGEMLSKIHEMLTAMSGQKACGTPEKKEGDVPPPAEKPADASPAVKPVEEMTDEEVECELEKLAGELAQCE